MNLTRGTREIRRVVVTGVGAVTPLGNSMAETWANLLEGKSGIAPITKFDTTAFDVKFAGEVKNFNADTYIPKKEQKKMDVFVHYALAATKMALEMAQFPNDPATLENTGTMVGVGIGGLPNIEETIVKLKDRGPGRISPFFIPAVLTNMASGQISIAFGFKGLNYSITSACATGAHSLGEAYNAIRYGSLEACIAGGTEGSVCGSAVGGFAAMRALSTRNDSPQTASRPFDKNRDGFVFSEGAAVMVLESLESALKRKAPIICEMIGYGASSDANHMTTPAPGGAGAAMSMRRALKDAGISPEQVQYINAHATSTPAGDELENEAIKAVFGDHAKKLLVGGTKSMTGHLLGAAGALESAICAMAIKDQVVPPTINVETPDEGCDLDYIKDSARKLKLDVAVNNSFGFGGTNATTVFARYAP